jgi:hypothetical protein
MVQEAASRAFSSSSDHTETTRAGAKRKIRCRMASVFTGGPSSGRGRVSSYG